jgi:hypothetical protein
VGTGFGRTHRWAGIIGIAVLVMTAAFAGTADGQTGGHDHNPDGILPEGDWTEQQIVDAVHMVEQAELVLPQFSDQSTLEELGFVNFRDPAPGGWSHWINRGWWDDEHILDPNYPESLVFRHTEQGDVLEAAMFFLPSQYDMSNIPEEYAWWPGWHDHEGELCEDENLQYAGLASGGECPPGSTLFESAPMMHVWIVDNPCGHRFAGIGIGGIECGPHHEPPGGHDHEHDPPTTEPPGGHDHHGGGQSTTSTTASSGGGTARPARPVRGTPDFVG